MKKAVTMLLLLVAVSTWGQQSSAQRPLSNSDILDMQKAKLSADTIIAAIESYSCNFDISPYALKDLKTASVPDKVIFAMMRAPAVLQAPAGRFPTADDVETYAAQMAGILRGIRHVNQQSLGKVSEHAATFKAVSYKSLLYHDREVYQTPGSSHTTCNNTTTGNIDATARPDYSGGANISGTVDSRTTTNCNTTYRPPHQSQIESRVVYNYNIVEDESHRFVISCTANVPLSKCAPLTPGDVFPAEVKGKHLWVTKKSEQVKYDILRVEPLQ